MQSDRNGQANLTRRATYATWWSALEISARYGVQLVVMVILARLLSPSDFGMIAMLLVFTTIAALFVDAGFGTALIQQQHTSRDDETTVFVACLGFGLTAGIVLWLAAPAIASFYSKPVLIGLTRLMAFVLPLSAMAAVPDALLTQRLDFRSRAKAEIIAAICSGITAIVLAWRGYGVWSLAWQSIIAMGLRAAMLWRFTRWYPQGYFRKASFRKLFGFGSYMFLSNLLNAISLRLQALLIGKLYDAGALGYYTLAQNTQQAPTQFIAGVLNRVGLPVFSSVNEQPEKLVGALQLSLRVSVFVFTPCMVGIAVVAKPLIVMLYGTRWVPASTILGLLSLSAAFWPLHVLNLAAIGAKGRSDLIFKLEIIKRTVSITAILASSMGGPVAIAWAVLASSVFGAVVNTWYSHKLLGYGALAQLHDQSLTLLLVLVAAVVGWLALHMVETGSLAMVWAIAMSAVAYVTGAFLLRHKALTDILEIVRSIRPPKSAIST